VFDNIYKGKKVFVTGNTGFKGSWLALWLQQLGAEVEGYALLPNTEPNHFHLLSNQCPTTFADIADFEKLKKNIQDFNPDIIFHLAAQPLVRLSYEQPIETYKTNVLGSLNVYEAARQTKSVKAVISITTDKVYENKEWAWGYRENDRLGGYDPYSASKACAEIMTASYRNSFLHPSKYNNTHSLLLATVRAGNVIGGGDWSKDRLIPDIMKSTAVGQQVEIRNPASTRPWQHVLDPLSGYLLLGQKLLEEKVEVAEAWNFGPELESCINVDAICNIIQQNWKEASFEKNKAVTNQVHEAGFLHLDSTKSKTFLKWSPVWGIQDAVKNTVDWYKTFYQENKVTSAQQLEAFVLAAQKQQLNWAK